MKKRLFGQLPTGEAVEAFTLEGGGGATLEFLTYGGIVRSITMPDRDGRLDDVVLGFDGLDSYLAEHPYFGAITGRVAGRTPGGQFTLEGRVYELEKNDGPNHLHGGRRGLDKRLWNARPNGRVDGADSILLTYHSPDGEEGYPGNVDIFLSYTLTRDNVFIIGGKVTSDRATPVCLTHHGYFNLAGGGDIFDHELEVHSDRALLVDERMTPLGRAENVAGLPNDFSASQRLGDAIPRLFQQHGDCYVLRGGEEVLPAARLYHPASGRTLSVSTNERCLQLYTGVHLDCASAGKSGDRYRPFSGLCLECQGYPAGIEYPDFGRIVVTPDEPQQRITKYAFSVR